MREAESAGGQDSSFRALLDYLRDERGFDFTGYKRTTVERRVRRRLHEVKLDSYEEYLDFLQVHPEEFTDLFNTLLINVTGFFRDGDAWETLRDQVLKPMVERKGAEPLRLWSAGCASGQEAYSLAILLADLIGREEVRKRVKIYATDVDADALADARQGLYAERDLRGLTADQVERYFTPVPAGFHVVDPALRRAVIFGRNDLVQDAPISRIDVLACRNTLMYFNSEVQSKILHRFHFALNPGGVLFLGKAETLLSYSTLFTPIHLQHRQFAKSSRPLPADYAALIRGRPAAEVDDGPERSRVEDAALMASPLAMLVLDRHGRVVLSNHQARTVFGVQASDVGRPFHDLELSYRPAELRGAILGARRDRRPVWLRDVEWRRDGGERLVFDIEVVPLTDAEDGDLGVAVAFADATEARQLQTALEEANQQLEAAYSELQSANEELETTNEELQSTVEELETTNEELQSTNEELETMNEELQSMNDELQAQSAQEHDRNTRLDDLNVFMESILGSLRAGIVVTDLDMRVTVWNRQCEELWGLRRSEVLGEDLLSLDIGLPLDELAVLATKVREGGVPAELEIAAVNRRGRQIVVQVTGSPLRALTGVIGVIFVLEQRADAAPTG